MSGRIALDLKQFKHLRSDDKSTTLQHKDGHELTIAHKPLSGEAKDQLKALAKMASHSKKPMDKGEAAEDSQQQLAKGGKVHQKEHKGSGTIHHSNPAKGLQQAEILKQEGAAPYGAVIVSPSAEDKVRDAAKGELSMNADNPPKKMASGGQIPRYAEGTTDVASTPPDAPTEPPPQVSDATQFDPNGPLPDPNAPYQQAFKSIYQEQKLNNPGQPDSESKRIALDAALRSKENDAADKDNRIADTQADAIANNVQTAKESAKMQALGMGSIPLTQVPQTPDAAAGQQKADESQMQQNQVAPPQQEQPTQGMPDVGTLANTMYGKGQQAIAGEQGVQEALGKQEQAAYQKKAEDQASALTAYQNAGKALEQERLAHIADIKNGHIDPELYWKGNPQTGEGSHSKVAAGIGMILAGFNPTQNPNAAINFLKYQMDQSMEAQKQNLSSNQNLLKANLDHFHNIKDAADMTRLQLNDVLQAQLGQAAATAKTAGARNAALMAQSKLAQDAIPIAQTLQMRQAFQSFANGSAGSTPNNTAPAEHLASQVMMQNPELGKYMQSSIVPGVGVSTNGPVPPEVRGQLINHQKLDTQARYLADFVKKHSGAMATINPMDPNYLKAQQMVMGLQSAIREGQLGTVYKQGEQPLLDKFVTSNPVSILGQVKALPQLEEVMRSNNSSFNTLKAAHGLPAAQEQQQQDTVLGKDGKQYRRQGKYMIPVK